jgi:hypothetical protein
MVLRSVELISCFDFAISFNDWNKDPSYVSESEVEESVLHKLKNRAVGGGTH